MGLLEDQYGPDDVMIQMHRGERLPTASEQWTLARAIKKSSIKDGNFFKKQNLEYASDDDFGEDLGNLELEDLEAEQEGIAEAAEEE